jgi:hypothetical protein
MRHVLNAKWHPFSVSPILTPNALRPSEVLPSRRLTPELSRSRIEVLPPSYARRHPSFRSTNMVRTTQMVCTIAEAEAIVKAAYCQGCYPAGALGRVRSGSPGREGAAHLHEQALSCGSPLLDRLHRWAEFARRGAVPSRVVANPVQRPPGRRRGRVCVATDYGAATRCWDACSSCGRLNRTLRSGAP